MQAVCLLCLNRPLLATFFFFFLWPSLGSNQYRAGRVFDLCVYYMKGAPEGSTGNISVCLL